MSLKDRMNSGYISIIVPLCSDCKNCNHVDYRVSSPFEKATCKKVGMIPKEIYRGKIKECKFYEPEEKR